MNIEEFRATGRDVPDLNVYGCTPGADERSPGRLYAGNTYIEQVNQKGGKWLLTISNDSWLTNDLTDLEVRLYDWARTECDLDKWAEEHNGGPEDIEARLSDLLHLWCAQNRLPFISADELLNSIIGQEHEHPRQPRHVAWLRAYIALWEATV
jgi:hypothetical protein